MGKVKLKRSFRVLSVEPDELMFAFGVADAAASLKMPVENPSEKALNLLEKDGSVMTIRFTDRPMNRAMLAVGKHFKGAKFRSIMLRIFALHEVCHDPQLSHWMRQTSTGVEEVAESLLAAAAQAPMSSRLKFKVTDIAKLASEYDRAHELVDGEINS